MFVDGVGLVVANVLILQGCKRERTSFLSIETHKWYQAFHITLSQTNESRARSPGKVKHVFTSS